MSARREMAGSACKHRWEIQSWSSAGTVFECCLRCKERRERGQSPAEAREYQRWVEGGRQRMKALHGTAWSFEKALGDKSGYDATGAADAWAEKRPKAGPGSVKIVRVDDAVYAGSSLVFVTHEDPEPRPRAPFEPEEAAWFGVDVTFIPQCTGEKPVRFFLYPQHLQALVETLDALRQRMLSYPDARRELGLEPERSKPKPSRRRKEP